MRTRTVLEGATLLGLGTLFSWPAAAARLPPDAHAQDKRPAADKPKMATDIPPAITIPDAVETRLGALKFKDGFLGDATVQKVYDNLDLRRGVQAFLTAMPAASLSAMRKGIRSFGPDIGTALIAGSLLDARWLFLTANTESVHAVAWLDLKKGPVVVEGPPNT